MSKDLIGGIWINKEFKHEYEDSKKNGLRIRFHGQIPEELKNEIKRYLKFLRKGYWFPIQCTIHLCRQNSFLSKDRKHINYGIFLYEDKKFPEIFIPVLTHGKIELCKNIIYDLTRLITYYYQWYFYEDKERNNRSLEIEATKYANYLVSEFYNT